MHAIPASLRQGRLSASGGEFPSKGLRETGMAVEAVGDGIDGLSKALSAHYHLLIVDVMLSGKALLYVINV